MARYVRYAAFAALGTMAGLSAGTAWAQLELPRPSPTAKVSQTVGLTDVTVEYSSPAVNGRKIWGGLVPYDQMWRTGANLATKISFSRDVIVGDKPVPAGSYALFTIPAKASWTIIFNKKADQSGTGRDYDNRMDQARIQVQPKPTAHRERMTFFFSDFTDDRASLDLEWEKLRLSIPLRMSTQEHAMANIAKAVDGAWRTYANAARYVVETRKDYSTGLAYIDQSLALKEDWLNVWIKATILAGSGRVKEAVPLGERAYQMGKKAEVFFLEPEIKKTLAEWKKKV